MQTNHLSLFGLDLSQLAARWRRGWDELLGFLATRGILPSHRVTMRRSDGSRVLVRVPGFLVLKDEVGKPAGGFEAIELPADIVLERELAAPVRSAEDLLAAARLDIESSSPFPADDTVWGWRPLPAANGPARRAQLAISSRRLVQAELERAGLPDAAEVWAATPAGYIVLQGYGEGRRHAASRRQMRIIAWLAAAAALLAGALVISPLWQKRQQVIESQVYAAQVTAQSAPIVTMREELGRLVELRETLGASIEAEPDTVVLLDYITTMVPDGAWLDLFEYQPGRLRIAGRADDAAGLLQALQAHPAFTNVRAPSPISREANTGKERFVIELDLVK